MVVSSWDGRGGWLGLWAGLRSPIPSAPRLASSSWDGWRRRGMRLIHLGRLEEQRDEAHPSGKAGEEQGDEAHPCRVMVELGQALWQCPGCFQPPPQCH